jgi:transposase-like protein
MTTLDAVYRKFPTEKDCIAFLESAIWQGSPSCRYCGSTYITDMPSENRHHCNSCNRTFSITVRTMFHKTRCELQKWFYLILLFIEAPEMPSVRKVGEEIGVTKDTALRMVNKIKSSYVTNKPIIDTIVKSFENGK